MVRGLVWVGVDDRKNETDEGDPWLVEKRGMVGGEKRDRGGK